MINSAVANNTSSSSGGGIWTSGPLTLIGSTVSGNIALGATGVAQGDGGGIYNNKATINLTNMTINNNQANNGSQGGAIYTNFGSVTLNNVTIAGNSSNKSGGGIYNNNDTSTVTLHNTILSNNSTKINAIVAESDCYGKMTSQGYNLVKSVANCTIVPTNNIIGQDAGLGQLKNNGGRTLTMLPQPGSPAIDHGNGCVIGDQRGAARYLSPA